MLHLLLLLHLGFQGGSNCADPVKSHQFDFWIGEWEVYTNGVLAGHSTVQAVAGDCVLHEHWRGLTARGTSLNYYESAGGQWHQIWVWENGKTLPKLSGGLEGKSMVLQGVQKTKDGEVLHKIAWTPNEDGTVRQHWEVSNDGGKFWQTSFDGLYKPVKK